MKQVTKDMNIREMVMMDEGIAEILMGAGMHCLGCMMSHFENLEQACAVPFAVIAVMPSICENGLTGAQPNTSISAITTANVLFKSFTFI